MKSIKTIEIRTASKAIAQKVEMVQSDSGRQIRCIIVDMTITDDAKARIYAQKPDGTEIYNDCEVSGNEITVNITTQMLAAVGNVKCQINITSDSDVVTSFTFYIIVEKSLVTGSAIESKDEFSALENAIAAASDINERFTEVNDNLTNMLPGGTNILRNTNAGTALASSGNWATGAWRIFGNAGTFEGVTITNCPNPDIAHGRRLAYATATTSYVQRDVPLIAGQEYTISCYVRLVSGNGNGYLLKQDTTTTSQAFVATVEWKRYTYTFVSNGGNTQIVFANTTAVGMMEFCGEKLEVGNKATDWSPSPWDIDNPQNEWIELGLTSDFQAYGNTVSNTPMCKRDGNIVNVRGVISPTSATNTIGSATPVIIGSLPSGYRPPLNTTHICQGSGSSIWVIEILTGGTIRASRYRENSAYVTPGISAWMPFNITFMI